MTPPLRRCAASPQGDAALRPAKPDRRLRLAQDTSGAGRPVRGFTLLELMVVVAIMALATAGVSLALRDSSATQLEQEGLRLSALLESARAQSRTSGVPLMWRSNGSGFEFIGATRPSSEAGTSGRTWLHADTRVLITRPDRAQMLVLGPEPLIPAQRLVLMQGERRLTLGTDGLSPFAVVPEGVVP